MPPPAAPLVLFPAIAVLPSTKLSGVSEALIAEMAPPGEFDRDVLLPLTVLFKMVICEGEATAPPGEESPVVLLPLSVLFVIVIEEGL